MKSADTILRLSINVHTKLQYILCLAILIRVLSYFLVNVVFYGYDTFGHPDSYLYHYITLELRELWNSNDFSISRYPEYTNLTAILYYLPGPERLWPELLNILASVATVYIGYLTVYSVTANRTAANIIALILAVDPYMVYLSTQYLRDAIILFGLALLVYGYSRSTIKSSLAGVLIVSLLRPLQALVLVPTLIFSNKRAVALTLLTPILIITVLHNISWGVDLTTQVPIPPNAVHDGGPHIKFFSSVTVDPVNYRKPKSHLSTLVNPLSYTKALGNFLFFPNPLEARTTIEKAFSLHALLWYGIIVFGFIGLASKPELSKEFKVLLVSGLVLGIFLALTSASQGPFVRWRLQLYYLMLPSLSLGLSYLLSYGVRKRAIDIIVSLVSLILLSPLILAISCILFATQRKVIFKQTRIGLREEPFTIYKFVTMKPNSDGKALVDDRTCIDPRVTKFGEFLRKTTLDEIPSLLNVLKGEMTIVGPRPLAKWEHDTCKTWIRHWNKRYRVRPGMIGLAQLKTDRRDNYTKCMYDIYYILRKSHRLDLQIFLKGLTYNVTGRWR